MTDKEFFYVKLAEAKALRRVFIGFERRAVLYGAYVIAFGHTDWNEFAIELNTILEVNVNTLDEKKEAT